MARFGRLGWFLGLIFGALFGVLFAPRKGKDLRYRIKAERKRGKLGLAPLKEDLRHVGQELAAIAKEIYQSEPVQEIVEKGREQLKNLSQDFVGEVGDFHVRRISPLQEEFREGMKKSKESLKKAGGEFRVLKQKVKRSMRVGKKALREIGGILKKRDE